MTAGAISGVADDADIERVRLDISGMTCSSCAARIEKRLNKLDGVDATVNYATEQATVSFETARVTSADLLAAADRHERAE